MKITQILFCSYLFLIAIPVQPVKAICTGAICNSRCPTENVYVQGDTATYQVVICNGKGGPSHYIGTNKINGSSIFLPLASFDSGDSYSKYVARNGKSTYTLITNENNSRLIIKSPGKKTKVEAFTVEQP
jgi:hypothetical protein